MNGEWDTATDGTTLPGHSIAAYPRKPRPMSQCQRVVDAVVKVVLTIVGVVDTDLTEEVYHYAPSVQLSGEGATAQISPK